MSMLAFQVQLRMENKHHYLHFMDKDMAEKVVSSFLELFKRKNFEDYEFILQEINIYEKEEDFSNDVLDAINMVFREDED